MRTGVLHSMAMAPMIVLALSCASTPNAGPLGEGFSLQPTITAVDTSFPPRSVWAQLDQPAYTVVLLVVPGHSATLLYPSDSLANNRLSAGAHQLTFLIPGLLVMADSIRDPARERQRADSVQRARERARQRTRTGPSPSLPAVPLAVPTYLLLVTSPQPLHYARIIEKTAGVSIPNIEMEALNAVAKAIKSTIVAEPREWAGYYQRIQLRRPKA